MLSFNGLIIYAYLHSERVHWWGGGRRIWSPDFTLNIRATVQTDQKGAIERFRNLKTADENQKGETEFLIATERRQRCRVGREMAPASPVWQQVASGCTSVITIICRFFLFCFVSCFLLAALTGKLNKTVCDLFTSAELDLIKIPRIKMNCWLWQSSSTSKIKDSNTSTQPRVRVWTVFFSKLAPSAGQRGNDNVTLLDRLSRDGNITNWHCAIACIGAGQ